MDRKKVAETITYIAITINLRLNSIHDNISSRASLRNGPNDPRSSVAPPPVCGRVTAISDTSVSPEPDEFSFRFADITGQTAWLLRRLRAFKVQADLDRLFLT